MLRLVVILSLLYICTGNVIKRNQCRQNPAICPQWCRGTDPSGCPLCDCSGLFSGSGSSMNGLGAVSGISMVNPGNMIAFGKAINFGPGIQQPPANNQMSNLMGGLNPGNMGPQNPFLSSGAKGDPSNPSGFGDPSNFGQNTGTNNPANPGIDGNVGTGGIAANGGPVTGGNGQINTQVSTPVPTTTTTTSTTKLTTTLPTTTKPTTSKLPASAATTTAGTVKSTCAPLRCVAPCDHGVALAPNGCPVCVCH